MVRAPNWIGDAVMCTPALSGLRSVFPDAKVTVLANPTVGAILEENPVVDSIQIYERKGRHRGLLGRFRLARELAEESYDFAILFQNAFEAALLAWLAGIPQRYGYPTDGRGALLTLRAPRPTANCHQIDYYTNLVAGLGASASPPLPALVTTEAEDRAAREMLVQSGIRGGGPIVGINPGATYGSAKQWGVERFAEVADRLSEVHRAEVIIFGGPGEEGLGEDISSRMKGTAFVTSGRLTVRQLMALIKQCSLFVTNDSGPMHIAAAFGVPLVAIFGPTDPDGTSPVGKHYVLVRNPVVCSPCMLRECPIDHRCMKGVLPQEVYDACRRLLIADTSGATVGGPVR